MRYARHATSADADAVVGGVVEVYEFVVAGGGVVLAVIAVAIGTAERRAMRVAWRRVRTAQWINGERSAELARWEGELERRERELDDCQGREV